MKALLVGAHRLLFRWLAPADFRSEYGPDVESLFGDLIDGASRRGRRAMVRVWWVEVRQLLGVARDLSASDTRAASARAIAFDELRLDLALAASSLLKRPLFTASVLVTLVVGIGLTTAVYSVARVSVLAPLPVPDPDELTVITGLVSTPHWTGRTGVTARELSGVLGEADAFGDFALFSLRGDVTVTGGDRPHRMRVSFVSRTFFHTLGVEPALGRTFSTEPAQVGPPEAVLAHHTWVTRFGGDPDVVGQTTTLSGTTYTIVGVMGESHWGVARSYHELDAWLPLHRAGDVLGRGVLTSLTNGSFWAIARRQPEVTPRDAELALQAIHGDFARGHPLPEDRTVATLGLREFYFGGTQSPFTAVAVGALLVLLICAVNVSYLIGLRLRQRHEELGVRMALGASRSRVLQTALAESALLGVVGAGLALLVAHGALRWIASGGSLPLLRFGELRVEPTMAAAGVAFAFALTALATLVAVCQVSTRAKPGSAERASRGAAAWAPWVIAAEAALSMVVVVGVVLSLRSLGELRAVELGYEPVGLHSARMDLVGSRHAQGDGPARFARDLVEAMERQPGVSAGAMGPDMMGRSVTHVHVTPLGLDPSSLDDVSRVQWISLTPGTLETLGMHLIAGRDVAWSDRADAAKVAVISERTAELLWPGQPAVGKRFHLNQTPHAGLEVVGVVRDARHVSRYSNPYPVGDAYFPFAQKPTPRVSLMYRAGSAALSLADVETAVQEVDEQVALYDAQLMSDRVIGEEGVLRLVLSLLAAYGTIALGLAVCGIVSLIATSVEDRRHEIAIRNALGAEHFKLMWVFTRSAVVAVVGGVSVGAMMAAKVTVSLDPIFFGVSPTDPATYALVAITLVAIGVVSAWVPAQRTSRVSPGEVMRV